MSIDDGVCRTAAGFSSGVYGGSSFAARDRGGEIAAD